MRTRTTPFVIALGLMAMFASAEGAAAQNSAMKPAGGAASTDATMGTPMSDGSMKPTNGTAGSDMSAPASGAGPGGAGLAGGTGNASGTGGTAATPAK